MSNEIFENLFVLEVANNHWGSVDRGIKIINTFSKIARKHNIKCAIKLQFRHVDTFVHKNYYDSNQRYIQKTLATKMEDSAYADLVACIRDNGHIAMATPFDETSVELCKKMDLEIIKIASSDINDKVLLPAIARLHKPVIVSTGGASMIDIDHVVNYFLSANIPIAINHCVSLYPTEKKDLELNQIEFLKNRYKKITIGFSTHEFNENADISIMLAYAKGARIFERHIDIEADGINVSNYCALPHNIEDWFLGYKRAVEMCGHSDCFNRRVLPEEEIKYLDALVRGVYAKRDLSAGEALSFENIYLAIPLHKKQISCREYNGSEKLLHDVKKDYQINIDDLDCVYGEHLSQLIIGRGL